MSENETTADRPMSTNAAALGEIIWLMSRSARHQWFFMADIEWMLMPPILLGQYRLFHDEEGRPIGVALWAKASDLVAKRLAAGHSRLAPDDWRSGDTNWLAEIIAPFGGLSSVFGRCIWIVT